MFNVNCEKMKKSVLLLLLFSLMVPTVAQQKKNANKQKAKTTHVAKPAAKSQTAKGKTARTKQNGTAQKGKVQTAKATSAKKKGKTQSSKSKGQNSKTPVYTNENIKGLQNQRAAIQKKIKEQQQLLSANRADVKKRLQDLQVINTEIGNRQRTIDTIQSDIKHIDGNISLLQTQLKTLEEQLKERKAKYVRSMRYMARHRTIQDQLMFIFSAKNLTQMHRRLRFVRDYASYQKAQGEMVKAKQQQIDDKHKQLQAVKGQKHTLLNKGKKEQAQLATQQEEQQKVVTSLQKQQKTIQAVIDEQQKKDAALNAEIDRLIAEEVAKARARAEAEARKKAAEEEAARKRRAEELARKKAEAEAAARENARRVEEARKAEAKAKEEARKAARRDAAAKARAEQRAREAEAARLAAERKARVEKERHEHELETARTEREESLKFSSEDRRLSGNFASNKGRLPMPITGGYRIVSHFGQYNVEGLHNVRLDNKGINILGQAGAQARAVFDGEVSAIFGFAGSWVVMVRHGSYISVYCNLRSVSVSKGQKVSTRQVLGPLASDNMMQFQLRRETAKLNPEQWLKR